MVKRKADRFFLKNDTVVTQFTAKAQIKRQRPCSIVTVGDSDIRQIDFLLPNVYLIPFFDYVDMAKCFRGL